jgi:tetratricopeptide (TPR) repeat protein
MAMVPRYCIHSQGFRDKVPGGNNPAEIERWSALMGQVAFHHIHHYCGGLMETNRAMFLSRTRAERDFYLSHAIVEFDYVIDRTPPDFRLLPEILAKKGANLIRLGQGPRAIAELQRAIELRQDYWPPYAELSDYYKDAGDLRKAREYLETGLSHSPSAEGLKRRLTELDALRGKRKPTAQ